MTASDGRGTAQRLGAWGTESKAAFAEARDPARLASAVVTFHARVDEAMAATIAGHEVPIACKPGCAYCCHLRVQLVPAEAFALAAWLRKRFAPARLAAVIARLRANAERTRALGDEARKRTTMACALLGEDGTCTAYEARPAQCRRCHSTDVAPCKSFHEDPSQEALQSSMHEAVAHNAAVIITQARNAARDAGLDAASADMNDALLEALENPKAWRRWRDGKKAFVGP